MIPIIIASFVRLILGTIYPAYASYKAIRTKTSTNQYKWLMYWIVFAVLCSVEGIADVLFGLWPPFYIEMKILMQIWLVMPTTQRSLGSGIIYQRFIHRYLIKREGYIDRSIASLQEQGYTCIAQWSKNILQSLANQLYNLVISAPVYAAQFVQKYGHVEVNQVQNQETRFSGFFQDLVDNMGSKLSSGNEKYDNERFEEIDSGERQVVEVIELENDPLYFPQESYDNINTSLAQPSNIKQVRNKVRKQPKRTATKKVAELDENSDNMQIDDNTVLTNSSDN